ncbi:16S rRNA (guanine(966)-N(2))-methyltransferase RsmD [Glaciimonas immobilis]|uniref:16S rRNA (Guanine(966)-N(2))-methyltransferase RsmD n=1 Tax=Glaciimonas immobilis TaxID=728004 RepID=A0A840RPE3_9BURK|nr:16S rRNA (guanine(966)-N(2))-methyltransferase RsmD [Glaciimonas immobilis]KAF3999777.1 16S rRNA (guanine(966)-N(2))-methyltransferase RsmD [Glaciimonas immobilis]MBB5200247.1 16S rRNA (guanine(966)-N(2))-methyltransferase RsmD [Glaciimonas immobilis]
MKQSKKSAVVHHQRPAPPRQVRIIGGQWKRTPLVVIDSEGLRPTPDRVRETVFNWLTHIFDGQWAQVRCLDLFAGTGALGFEAASRGAAAVLMIEHNTPAVRQLEATKAKLDAAAVTIQRGDASTILQAMGGKASVVTENDAHKAPFDLIFLDPPYHQGWLGKTLPLCERLLSPSGLIYVEAENSLLGSDGLPAPEWLAGWQVVRSDKAGIVFYHLLQR